MAEKLWGWNQWMDQWEKSDVLILDEISMVDCDLLEEVRGLNIIKLKLMLITRQSAITYKSCVLQLCITLMVGTSGRISGRSLMCSYWMRSAWWIVTFLRRCGGYCS